MTSDHSYDVFKFKESKNFYEFKRFYRQANIGSWGVRCWPSRLRRSGWYRLAMTANWLPLTSIVVICCQKLSFVAKSCNLLPFVAKSCQDLIYLNLLLTLLTHYWHSTDSLLNSTDFYWLSTDSLLTSTDSLLISTDFYWLSTDIWYRARDLLHFGWIGWIGSITDHYYA